MTTNNNQPAGFDTDDLNQEQKMHQTEVNMQNTVVTETTTITDSDKQSSQKSGSAKSQISMQMRVPNSGGILALGILSIAMLCCCGPFLGPILAIIALIMAGTATRTYKASPESFTATSFGNVNAGKVCAIIGLALGGFMLIFFIISLVTDSSSMNFSDMEDLYEGFWDAMNY